MIYDPAPLAIFIFLGFVFGTVGLSFYLGRKAKSSEGYFAAHGQIPWAVNGVAFAGDYLSAASFLGICGMIAAYNDEKQIHHCKICNNRTDFAFVKFPFAGKLLFQELITMNIAPRILTE